MKYILVFLSLVSLKVMAGPGHEHSHGKGHSHSHEKSVSISKEQTQAIGRYHVERLVKAKKIDKSWLDSSYEKTIQKTFGKRKEWVLTFVNDKGIKGKKLYIFLKLSGEFIAANFSGK
ncbi:DUF6488 family protein [Bacteriovorax sp. DB6_IX]|uniref:DUF6488 family protein n=1 Tax=Bacteriovorax sp. DB6_IX TaxID=1353530 RepID=UPI00038A3FC6|nr:DUF6488 family protein [Bacteriovorax sp. DB6_IX]EQC50941.1 hypothetical protein M901_1171 [Bacteriovorax sp. DB6_IX]